MNDLSLNRPDKFKAYRARKKRAGLREVRMWVPDINSPEFKAKLARDMAATSVQEDERDVMIFIERMTEELWKSED